MRLTVGLSDALRITRALRAQRVDLHSLPHGELQAPDPSPAKRWSAQAINCDALLLSEPPSPGNQSRSSLAASAKHRAQSCCMPVRSGTGSCCRTRSSESMTKSGYPDQRCSLHRWGLFFPPLSTSRSRSSFAEPTPWTPTSPIAVLRRSASLPQLARKRYVPFSPPTLRLTSGECNRQEASHLSLLITPGLRWKPLWRPCSRYPSQTRAMASGPWSSTSDSLGALPSSERAPLAFPTSSLQERTLASTTTAAITFLSIPLPTPALTLG